MIDDQKVIADVRTLVRVALNARSALRVLLLLSFAFGLSHDVYARSGCENYYLFSLRYPDLATPNWGDDKTLTNGIAHDDNNWYIVALGTDDFCFPSGDWIICGIPCS